ncbi:MAG TPA: metallophosphoesterase family protein [Polyangiaceae bacterium]|nr:metallophosphoesterase family protein [Polyangiaceae bacterium]
MARSIFIGDVHSCAAELAELFSAVAVADDDRVYFVGDLLSRGPDARGVLNLFRAVRARSVMGNHEQRLLASRHARQRGEPGPKLGASHAEVAVQLNDDDWAVLESFPLWIDVAEHGVRVVHAGVVPGVPFEAQDPWLLTHIRSITEDGKPSEKWGTLWGCLYTGSPHIVFGHNARQRPQIHPAATGLDTACVYGGALTALVLPDGAAPPPPDSRLDALVSVRARRAYSDYGRDLPGG